PASARLSASMIWLSVKRDFFIVEILLARSLLLKTLVLRGDYPRSGQRAWVYREVGSEGPLWLHGWFA
ncbi:hypothetical protein, partial [Pseudomonas aeruginosa]|uniref:hypothetical protein n=1 Tax=Pseudomonas aeruginosa TaxID=287 RepID=UPI001C9D9736